MLLIFKDNTELKETEECAKSLFLQASENNLDNILKFARNFETD